MQLRMKFGDFVLVAVAAIVLSGCETVSSTWDSIFGLDDTTTLTDENSDGSQPEVIWVLGDR